MILRWIFRFLHRRYTCFQMQRVLDHMREAEAHSIPPDDYQYQWP